MKKIVLLFTFLMTLALQAGAEKITINGSMYLLNTNGTAILLYGADRKTVEIPAQVSYNGNNYAVTSIGDYAFQSCFSLTSITIPNSVTSIGDYAFCECYSLTSIIIPNSVTSIGKNTFSLCGSLTSVTIPNSVTSIGDRAFNKCRSLTSITIPNSVTSIGDYAFYECRSLTSITIPNSVTSIGDYAFYGCSSLKSVTSLIEEPFFIRNVFRGIDDTATLYVPNGTKAAYETTEDWTDYFANVVELGDDPSAILGPSAPQAAGEDAVYNLNGVRIGQPTKQGIYIVNGKKVAMP